MTYEELILGEQVADRYWRLGDANGQSDIVDETGNVPEADTIVSGATLGGSGLLEGDADTSASFDGTDDNISMEDTEVATTLSISLWFSNGTSGPDEGMICKSNSSTVPPSGQAHIGITVDNLGRVAGSVWDGSSHQLVEGPSGADDGQPHHVVMTVESGVGIILYYDGAQVDTSAVGTPAISDHTHWWLGISEIFSSIQNPWSGVLDEVAIFHRVLTSAEVEEQYFIGSEGPILEINGAFGGGFDAWGDEAWGEDAVEDTAVTAALAATTGAAAAAFVGEVQNPITGALAATVAPAAADFDAVETFEGALAASSAASQAALVGVVANPVTGELAGTTAAAQADLDAIEDFPAELAAATAPAQADLDGQVDGPFVGELAAQTGAAVADLDGEVTVTVVGELAAQTAPAVAQLRGIAGEEAPPVGGVSWKAGLPVEDKPRRRLVLGRLHVEFERMACEGRALVRIRSKSAVARLRGSMAIAQGLVAPKPQVVGFGEIPMSGLHAAGCAEPVYPPDPVMAELLGLEAIAEEIR